MKLTLFSFVGCDPYIQDENLFHHFLKYYLNMRIDKFNLILHSNENTDKNVEKFKNILSSYGIPIFYSIYNIPYYNIKRKLYKELVINESKNFNKNDWFVYADADEFINTDGVNFKEFLAPLTCNCVTGRLRERLSESYKLEKIQKDVDLYEQFPVTLNLKSSMRLGFGTSKKVCFTKYPYYLPSQGHHRPNIKINGKKEQIPNIHDKILMVDHFRWSTQMITNYQNRLASKKCKIVGKSKVTKLVEDCIALEHIPNYVIERIEK